MLPVMKNVFVITLLLVFSQISVAQGWEWSNHISCAGDVKTLDMAIDDNDNIYVAGRYDDQTLYIESDTIHNFGGRDGFICKFNSSGSLLWLRRIGGTGNDLAITIEIINNSLFVAGNFNSPTLYFTLTDVLNNDNSFDAFLAEYDLDGNFIDAYRIFSGTNQQRILNMTYDPNFNDLVIVGYFIDEMVYDDGSTSQTIDARGSKDLYIFRSNYSAEIQDTATFYVTANSSFKTVNLSLAEGYYIGADLRGTMFFTPDDSIQGNSSTNTDALIIKVDEDLDFDWARKGGGIGYDHVNSAVSDIYGNYFLTGKVESTITFDSTATLQSHSIPSFGTIDLFLAKYNKQGTLQWLKRKGNIGNDNGYGLVQRENLVQFCGNIALEVIFNVDTLRSTGSTDVNTGFAIFDINGNEIGAQGIGGTGTDLGEMIVFNSSGNTIIGGYFNSPSLVIGDSTHSNSSGNNNGFIGEYYYPMNAVYTTINSIDCNGGNEGELIVTPYFGVGPYSYNWSHAGGLNDSTASNLSAGTYSVTITDSRDSTAFTTINLNEPAPISIAAVLADVSCHPNNGTSNDGGIDLTVTGGTVAGPYSYAWEAIVGSGVNATAEDQTTLTMGEYSVTVTDDNLCMEDDTFLIAQPDPIQFTGSVVTDATGGGNDGAIDLNPSGGNDTPPYTSYAWSSGQTTEDISSLFAGSYTVTVADVLSCEQDTTLVVSDLSLFLAFISDKTDVDCRGSSTGSATVATSGGTGPYSYAWEDAIGTSIGGDFPTITNVPASTYYVTVTDNSDMRTAPASVIITEPSSILSAFITGTNLRCYDDNSGVADLSVSGGNLPYAFIWSNGGTTEDLVNIPAGDYSVSVTDINNCTVIENVTIDEPEAMDINITIVQPIFCYGDLTGTLTATATGGTGTKTYVWDDPGNQTAQTATNLGGGFYNVTATDLNLCQITDNIQLVEPDSLSLSASSQDISCSGESDGSIALTVSGGTPAYTFVWSNGEFTQNLSDLIAGIYSVTITDQLNCTKELLDIEINEPEGTTLTSEEVTDATCFLSNDGTITVSASNPVGSLTYSTDGISFADNGGIFTDLSQGSYDIWAMDGDGCVQMLTTLSVGGPGPITLDTTVNHSSGSQGGSIIAVASGGNEPYNYILISPTTNNSNSTGEFEELDPDDYELHAVDAISCSSDTLLVTILQSSTEITLYEAFSPNGDGINDLWNIPNISLYPNCKVSIFNTWGNKVFSSDGYTEPWDGKYNGNDLPAGTYYYTIDPGDGSKVLTGPVSIVR